jgi:ferredoxin-type protein NapF
VKGIVCRACEDRCEMGAIRFIPRAGHPALPKIDLARCTNCGECATVCPAQAIALRPTEAAAPLATAPAPSTPIRRSE